jgi:gamma-glutamylcyclotransferase (GGCT)/AIG2-like uncharacterized protein YtfP
MVIAVYGTLRKGLQNHGLLKRDEVNFLGLDTVSGYDLYAGEYPYLTQGSGVVIVELYEINESVLRELDTLEGHPDLYYRTSIVTSNEVKADIYLYPKNMILSGTRIVSGDWIEWLNTCKN